MDNRERLSEWESSLSAELEDLRKRRSQLDAELQRTAKKLELVRQMRTLEELQPAEMSENENPTSEPRATPNSVKDAAKKILMDAGRPLHISEIHRQFTERNYPIPGSGTPFNVLAHMVNEKSFVRVARGTYAIAGTVPPEQILPKAPRKRARRRKKKTLRTAELGS